MHVLRLIAIVLTLIISASPLPASALTEDQKRAMDDFVIVAFAMEIVRDGQLQNIRLVRFENPSDRKALKNALTPQEVERGIRMIASEKLNTKPRDRGKTRYKALVFDKRSRKYLDADQTPFSAATAPGSPGYAAAEKEALRLAQTDVGYDYSAKFMAALDKEEATRNAMRACIPGIPGRKTDIRCGIVFVVSADGRISLLRETDHPVALCFARAFKAPRHVPRPPRDQWPVPYAFVFGP